MWKLTFAMVAVWSVAAWTFVAPAEAQSGSTALTASQPTTTQATNQPTTQITSGDLVEPAAGSSTALTTGSSTTLTTGSSTTSTTGHSALFATNQPTTTQAAGSSTALTASQPTTTQAASSSTTLTTSQPATRKAPSEAEIIQATAEKRAAVALEGLLPADAAKEAKARQILVAFYAQRIAWAPHDERLKDLDRLLARALQAKDEAQVYAIRAERSALRGELVRMRESLLAELAGVLAPEQIQTVKDRMTYGQATILYDEYLAKHTLTDRQKAIVAQALTDARDQAMMAAGAGDKHRIFTQTAAELNNYLDAREKLDRMTSLLQAGQFAQARSALETIEINPWLSEMLAKPLAEAREDLVAASTVAATEPATQP
ncbi:MAG: DUF3826 domain-containing protein [Phycisphaerae bacterium]|jgi:hypothetical protein